MNLLTPNIVKPGDQDNYELSFSGVQAGVDSRLDAIKVGAGMAVNNAGGALTITTGTTVNSETILRAQECFCGSLRLLHNMSLSQRIANNTFTVELVDVIGDGLAYTINSTTSVTVQTGTDDFSAKDVGKKLFIGALSSVGVPALATVASATSTSVTLTVVAWPASGSGTCSLFGMNFYQVVYDGTTATSAKFDSCHEGWGSAPIGITINSTAAPGYISSLHNDNGWARISDAAQNSNALIQRAARLMGTPAPMQNLVLQIRVQNGTTAPASTTTMSLGFLKIERFNGTQVTLAGDKVVDVAQTITGTVTASSISGTAAHDAVVSGNPVRLAGRALTTNYAGVATGDVADLVTTVVGALITKPYSIPDADWQYAAAAGGIVNTTDVAVKAAAAAGIRNYVTGVTIRNSHATVATEVVIKDGSTVIWRTHVPALSPEYNVTFPTPLKGTAATAVNVACITTGASVYVNCQGFIAP